MVVMPHWWRLRWKSRLWPAAVELVSGDFLWFALCRGCWTRRVEPRQTGFQHQNHMTTMSALVSLSLCGTWIGTLFWVSQFFWDFNRIRMDSGQKDFQAWRTTSWEIQAQVITATSGIYVECQSRIDQLLVSPYWHTCQLWLESVNTFRKCIY